MTVVFAAILILAVTAYIVLPLLRTSSEENPAEVLPVIDELWQREKAVALLAISEADFDRATGKLSDDDYRVLLTDYEDRALHAMGELERAHPPAAVTELEVAARYCSGCGSRFAAQDRFCAGCGQQRAAA